MKKIGIYKITSPTKKVYIGQSVDIKRRFTEYKRLACIKQIRLYNSFLKYSVNNHTFEIIIICDVHELNKYEQFYQEAYSCIGRNGLNCKITTSHDKSGYLSEQTKIKMSKGREIKTIARTSKLKGTKLSEEHIAKLKKRVISEETRLKISISKKGSKQSQEAIDKRIATMKGYSPSLETREKISIALKGRALSPTAIMKSNLACSKIVINTNTGDIYPSVIEVSKKFNLNYQTLVCKLNGTRNNDTQFIYKKIK